MRLWITAWPPELFSDWGYTLFPWTQLVENTFVASVVVVVGFLSPISMVAYAVERRRPLRKRALIVGVNPLARQIIAQIEAQPHCGYTIVGVVDDGTSSEDMPLSYPLLGPPERLAKAIEETHADRVIIALAERSRLPTAELLEAMASGVISEDGVRVYERLAKRVPLEWLTPTTILVSEEFRKSRLHLAWRQAVSVAVSMAALVALAPFLALIALAIKLDSAGPVFFVADRAGLHGRLFKLLKFRTMHPVSIATSEWAQDNDRRITRVGRWLRMFHLDELPQFINIIRGDMSLIGPRPHPVSNQELFKERVPYYCFRTTVRPGLTGWAQVRYGYANNLEEEIEKMRYDLYHIKHASLGLDLRILLETARIILFGQESMAGSRCPSWQHAPDDASNPIGAG